MLFSSMIFLWVFLPVVLILYYIIQDRFRNLLLLIASLVFYAWGEPKYIVLMLLSVSINYVLALQVERKEGIVKKAYLGITIIADLGLLFYFKYFNLFVDVAHRLFSKELFQFRDIALPIGISFYTFQAMSYVIDVYREETKAQKNWLKLALYISFFPQLIAGPIVKYKDIHKQIEHRDYSIDKYCYGVKRFIYGLGKKVIVSNLMAQVVDGVLETNMQYIGTGLSWCIAICYTLQIYFDFSGYSDMAIGLGKMFGFDILENFNFPYVSQSVQEFWRRWHISLSTWFKEYLYIPLGGNRKGVLRTYVNLFIVFFITGLWHGASYTFVVWGIYNGVFLILEKMFLGKILNKNPIKVINHIYTILVFVVGWVIFRCDTLEQGLQIIRNMFVYKPDLGYQVLYYIGIKEIIVLIIGILLSFVIPLYKERNKRNVKSEYSVNVTDIISCCAIFVYSIFLMICNTYNPFIYFRF